MNILLFDLENGSKTLGGHEDIKKMFNLPVLTPSSFIQTTDVFHQIYQTKTNSVQKDVGPLKINEEHFVTTAKDDSFKVDAVVIDTFSELSKKLQRTLADKDGKMQINQWGVLKNKLDSTLAWITSFPGIVICNCHSKIMTLDDGTNKVLPYIDGSSKEDVSKWFDFVLYTKTVNLPDGSNKFMWHTTHSSIYDHAKDRSQLLDREIPQDYQILIDAAKKKGWEGIKVLVIGSPGTGKTLSLKTLIKEQPDATAQKTVANGTTSVHTNQ